LHSPENVNIIEIREHVADKWSVRFLKPEEKKDKRFFMARICYEEEPDRRWAIKFVKSEAASKSSDWLGWKHRIVH